MLKVASRLMEWKKEGGTGEPPKLMSVFFCFIVVKDSCARHRTKMSNLFFLSLNCQRLQIHDELVFEVAAKEDEITLLKDIVMRCCTVECQNELQLKVPLKMDFKIGKSWGSAMREF
jgi:hypothetical protein